MHKVSDIDTQASTPTNSTMTTSFLSAYPANLDTTTLELASKILSVISRYRLNSHRPTISTEEGDFKFLAQIYSKVKAAEVIRMCLPAFPFKSPNSATKVLGRLPDKAEDFALAHLNGLCAAIQDIYPPGAKLMIISDGLVYNGTYYLPAVPTEKKKNPKKPY